MDMGFATFNEGATGYGTTVTQMTVDDSCKGVKSKDYRPPYTGSSIGSIDSDGRIGMRDSDIHIQSIANGFILTYHFDGDVKIYSFNNVSDLLEYMKNELAMMTSEEREVAEHV